MLRELFSDECAEWLNVVVVHYSHLYHYFTVFSILSLESPRELRKNIKTRTVNQKRSEEQYKIH